VHLNNLNAPVLNVLDTLQEQHPTQIQESQTQLGKIELTIRYK